MPAPTVIKSPFLSIPVTARKLGLSKNRVAWIEKLIDEIQNGRAVRVKRKVASTVAASMLTKIPAKKLVRSRLAKSGKRATSRRRMTKAFKTTTVGRRGAKAAKR